jgi:predicted O-methyltransferase YrrM
MTSQLNFSNRSIEFSGKSHGRYWWFLSTQARYVPPIFQFLTDDEWEVMNSWYCASEREYPLGTGECNVPAMCLIMGLVMGNNLSRVVQCGHFVGFSTLLLGLMAKHMQHKHAVFSIDINPDVTNFTAKWTRAAGLDEFVRLHVGDSADAKASQSARDYLGGSPQLIFIDSSHACAHTMSELSLWYPLIQPGGFVVLHDVSEYAVAFDAEGGCGVRAAIREWSDRNGLHPLLINDFCTDRHYGDRLVYKDACGLGIMQKPD